MERSTVYDARQIANWFIARAAHDGRKLSIMALLKLIYIAHGWHLEMKDRPLFFNRIEAWRYGPVIRDVYNSFRRQGIIVDEEVADFDKLDDPGTISFLEQIYNIYGKLPANRLSDMTHVKGGPWDLATQIGGFYAHIPNELITEHYVKKRLQAQAARKAQEAINA